MTTPCSEIDVCKVIIALAGVPVNLSSTCTISLSTDPASLQCWGAGQALHNSLIFPLLWVGRHDALRILFKTVFDGLHLGNEKERFIAEELAITLRETEIWHDLGLQASLSFPPGAAHDFQLSLTSIHEPSIGKGKCSIREDVIIADTRPPDGIPSAKIQKLRIEFTFLRDKLSHFSPGVAKTDFKCDGVFNVSNVETASWDVNLWSSRLETNFYGVQECKTNFKATTSTNLKMLEIDDSLMSGPTQMLKLLPGGSISKRDRSSLDPVLSTSPRGKRSRPSISATKCYLDTSSAMKLIDISFRSMICGSRIQMPGIKKLEVSPGRKLAEISPALFSPGYLPALSNCTKFIPTLAHAMSSVYCQTKSMVLKSVFESLEGSVSPGTQASAAYSDEAGQKHEQHLVPILQRCLWKKAQTQLFDPSAARSLKPLKYTGSACTQQSRHEDMLDQDPLPTPIPAADSLKPESQSTLLNSENEGFTGRGDDKDILLSLDEAWEGFFDEDTLLDSYGENEEEEDLLSGLSPRTELLEHIDDAPMAFQPLGSREDSDMLVDF